MPSERALILDFGGVIARTMYETHDLTERALGLPPGTLTWRGPFDPDNDALWRTRQAGKITRYTYWNERAREVGALVGENWTEFAQFVRAARGTNPATIVRPEFHTAMEKARSTGAKLAILANGFDILYGADILEKLPFLSVFDVIVDAKFTEIQKPDPRAYQIVVDALKVPARHCIFIDDQLPNIDGAAALGMKTIHFDVTRPQASYARAIDLLIPERTAP